MLERITLCSATLGEDGGWSPPGAAYIAAALESAGVEVDFRDYQLAPGANCFSGEPLADFLAGHGGSSRSPASWTCCRRSSMRHPASMSCARILGSSSAGRGPRARRGVSSSFIPGSRASSAERARRPSGNGSTDRAGEAARSCRSRG